MHEHLPAASVDENDIAILHNLGHAADADDCRNAERAHENGRVRGVGALFKHESQRAVVCESQHLRR